MKIFHARTDRTLSLFYLEFGVVGTFKIMFVRDVVQCSCVVVTGKNVPTALFVEPSSVASRGMPKAC